MNKKIKFKSAASYTPKDGEGIQFICDELFVRAGFYLNGNYCCIAIHENKDDVCVELLPCEGEIYWRTILPSIKEEP